MGNQGWGLIGGVPKNLEVRQQEASRSRVEGAKAMLGGGVEEGSVEGWEETKSHSTRGNGTKRNPGEGDLSARGFRGGKKKKPKHGW